MDKRQTQVLIGILVVIAIIIIALPLMTGGNSKQSVKITEIKAPPFSDTKDQEQTPTNSSELTLAKETSLIMRVDNKTESEKVHNVIEIPKPKQLTRDENRPKNPENVVVINGSKIATQTNVIVEKALQKKTLDKNSKLIASNSPVKPLKHKIEKFHPQIKNYRDHQFNHLQKKLISSEKWYIRMGVFRNPTNATQLTTTLRSKGYETFTRRVRNNGLTTVYVGPISSRNLAIEYINRIEQQIHLRGVVTH